MALVASWHMSVSLKDSGGNTAVKRYELRGSDYATCSAEIATILAALSAVTTAEVAGYSLSQRWTEDAFSYPTGSEIENQALLNIMLDGGLKTATVYIPSPTDGCFMSATGDGRNIVDVADTDVLAYVALFESGGEAYLSDGEDADSLMNGKRIHRASRKG